MTDFLVEGPSAETVIGTAGEDLLIYRLVSGLGGVVLPDLTPNDSGGYDGTFQTPEGEDTAFTGIEHFRFSDKVGGDDTITTGAGDDVLLGGAGRDVLTGGAGSDLFRGGKGADQILGGVGNDILYGGKRNDRLFGEDGDDGLYGEAGNDRLFGGDGADALLGHAGNDVLRGQDGRDQLFGGDGDDELFGGRKADRLEGGLGDDLLMGGFGRDSFVLRADPTGAGSDTILDFKNDVDTIEIERFLLPEGSTLVDLIDSATVVGGNTVLALRDGETLTIDGLTDPALLSDDLILF